MCVRRAEVKVRKAWLIVGSALLVSGCASDEVGPTPAELQARWDAQNVVPQNYRSDLIAFLRTYLNEPVGVRNAQASKPFLKKVGAGDRFIVCVRYRERKSSNAYAPPKDGAATFVSGKLDRFLDAPREVSDLCKDAPLEPFPELEKLTP